MTIVPCLELSIEQQSYMTIEGSSKNTRNRSTKAIKVEIEVPTYGSLIPPMRLKC